MNPNFTKGIEMFKKGDVVWSIAQYDRNATVSVNKLTIKSFGKVQGTASSIKDGKMINTQIYAKHCDHLFLASDVENIEEFAIKIAGQLKAKKIQHYVDCAHYAYDRNETYDNYYFKIKKDCQELMESEPKAIFNN